MGFDQSKEQDKKGKAPLAVLLTWCQIVGIVGIAETNKEAASQDSGNRISSHFGIAGE